MYVLGAEVARSMRSAAARGEVADLESARNGCGTGRQVSYLDRTTLVLAAPGMGCFLG